jgi:hypothetical protein
MAMNCYDESASYRAAKDIEDRITAREAEGCTHQEAELKGVEEYIECSKKWLFLKMFKTVLMKESKSMEEWDSQRIPNGKCLRDANSLYL